MEPAINYDYIIEYIRKTIKPNDEFMIRLENYANENYIPIVHPEVGKLLSVIMQLHKPKRILEIGTAIGYSSILMGKTLNDVTITTIERDENMISMAKANIKEAGFSDKIRIVQGEAEEILQQLDEEFDMIFIDAAKGQYNNFFEKCFDLLKAGGLLVSDNVLYRGLVATGELPERKHRTIIVNMRKYLDMLCDHPSLNTSLIPIGDGLALSYKKDRIDE